MRFALCAVPLFVLCAGCHPAEPLLNFGTGPKAVREVRHEPGSLYVINYPALNVQSFANVDPDSGMLLTEEFDAYYVEFRYARAIRVTAPMTIIVFTNALGRPGKKVNTYILARTPAHGIAHYDGDRGTFRDIPLGYFHVDDPEERVVPDTSYLPDPGLLPGAFF